MEEEKRREEQRRLEMEEMERRELERRQLEADLEEDSSSRAAAAAAGNEAAARANAEVAPVSASAEVAFAEINVRSGWSRVRPRGNTPESVYAGMVGELLRRDPPLRIPADRPMLGLDSIDARVAPHTNEPPPPPKEAIDPKLALQAAMAGPLAKLDVRRLWRTIDSVQSKLECAAKLAKEVEAAKDLARDAEERRGGVVYDVYISHTVGPTNARTDNHEHAERISGWLRKAGFRTAYEKHGEWSEGCSSASIEQSKAVVVCLSQR